LVGLRHISTNWSGSSDIVSKAATKLFPNI
jgi:hypothetical protein